MTQRYEMTHVTGEEPMTLVFPEGTFETLPIEVRLQRPWFGCSYGHGDALRPSQRLELARQGYTIIRDVHMLDAA